MNWTRLFALLVFAAGTLMVLWISRPHKTYNLPVGPAERAILLDAADLAPYLPGLKVDPHRETVIRRRESDGRVEVAYTYDGRHDQPPLIMNTRAIVESSAEAAKGFFTGASGASGDNPESGLTWVIVPDLFPWGEESNCKTLSRAEGPVGTLCVARRGNLVYALHVAGLVLDDSTLLKELLAEPLARFEAYGTD